MKNKKNLGKEAEITQVMKNHGLYDKFMDVDPNTYRQIRAALRQFGNVCAGYEVERFKTQEKTRESIDTKSNSVVPDNLRWTDIFTDRCGNEFNSWLLNRPDIHGDSISPEKLFYAVIPEFLKTIKLEIFADMVPAILTTTGKRFVPRVKYCGENVVETVLKRKTEYNSQLYALYVASKASNQIYNSFYGF